jgi:pimeloyl-ACP methyl ester carboxylesterase
VGGYPAIDWQAHYYVQLGLLPCSRDRILTQTAYNLFGVHSPPVIAELVRILEKDLTTSLSPHSLYRRAPILPSELDPPLLVSRGNQDLVVDPSLFAGWKPWLKEGDRLWECPHGRYFFHHTHPQLVKRQILNFWKSLTPLYSILKSA